MIVLDPGHGGDADIGKSTAWGARNQQGIAEKDVALHLAREVAARVSGPVGLTRDADVNLSIGARIAAGRGAGTFVSLHAHPVDTPRVWVHPHAGPASGQLAHALAAGLRAYGRGAVVQEGEIAVLHPGTHALGTAACLIEVDPSDARSLAVVQGIAAGLTDARFGALDPNARRLAAIKAKPSLFDQGGHGCCGFAAIIMGLLATGRTATVDALYKTATTATAFKNAPNSERVFDRIKKRFDAGFFRQGDEEVDYRLDMALMISFKEWISAGHQEVWNGVKTYSSLFPGWDYGAKLKDPNRPPDAQMSYKAGDIAMTSTAIDDLATFVGFAGAAHVDVISNQTLAGHKAKIADALTDQETTATWAKVVKSFGDKEWTCAVVGMAAPDYITQTFLPYNYVCHYVFLDASGIKADIRASVVWTWGGEYTFAQLAGTTHKMVPRTITVLK